MRLSIAVILPINQADYLGNTILDGLLELSRAGTKVDFKVTGGYPSPFDLSSYVLSEDDFIVYAGKADLVFLVWGKRATNYALAEKINKWDKTVFVDGSELGRDIRYNPAQEKKILIPGYIGKGMIDAIGKKCKLYFKRERPYPAGVIPLPFGIESRYISYHPGVSPKKDIDFVCIFGQDEYPIMRRYATKMVTDFCKQEGFVCKTTCTEGFNFADATKRAGRDAFSKLLARAKVGVSIGGGGFDTARFWEILGNNCLLLTEKIAIFEEGSRELEYDRIYQFENLIEFQTQLKTLGTLLRANYAEESLLAEYQTILRDHGAVARVEKIIDHARRAGIIAL